jgi:hypothetical protein
MDWWMIIVIGVLMGFYSLNKIKETQERDFAGQNLKKGDINLGNYNNYLDPDELCLFQQEDVAWYGYTYNFRDQMFIKTSMDIGNVGLSSISELPDHEPDNIWNVRAASTLYLTNKKVILYDKGFSNLWTKLSIEGSFPEQVMGFRLEEITDVRKITSGGLKGMIISTNKGQCILAPSHRKYTGRRTPVLNEYKSLEKFRTSVIATIVTPEIDRIQKQIDELMKRRTKH